MNPRTCPTDSIHYMHLADPSEEGDAIGEVPKIKTRSSGEPARHQAHLAGLTWDDHERRVRSADRSHY